MTRYETLKARFNEAIEAETAYMEVAGIWSCPQDMRTSLRQAHEKAKEDFFITAKNFFNSEDA